MMLRTTLALLLFGCSGASTTPPPTPPPTPAAVTPTDPNARRAPDFTLDDTEGNPVTLSRLLADGPVILAFFPKAFTGG
jgi:cytochrome oxidase Cu insertion factor (SCO1/SenC/PrrC family)